MHAQAQSPTPAVCPHARTALTAARHIIVADDDCGVRRAIARILQQRGYIVHQACDGAEALDLINRIDNVSLIILDVGMPRLDGLGALAALRQTSRRTVPAIIVSGWSEDAQILDGYRSGAEYYVTKPFRPATLANIVRYLIEDLEAESLEEIELAL